MTETRITPENKTGRWDNRIIEYIPDYPVDQLMAHPDNYKIHTLLQQEALRGLLDEVGWCDAVKVSVRSGRMVDGHARAGIALRNDEPTVPVMTVDLTEEEERVILAGFDPVGDMASIDQAMFDQLIMDLPPINSPALARMLEGCKSGKHNPNDNILTFGSGGGKNRDPDEHECPECGHVFIG